MSCIQYFALQKQRDREEFSDWSQPSATQGCCRATDGAAVATFCTAANEQEGKSSAMLNNALQCICCTRKVAPCCTCCTKRCQIMVKTITMSEKIFCCISSKPDFFASYFEQDFVASYPEQDFVASFPELYFVEHILYQISGRRFCWVLFVTTFCSILSGMRFCCISFANPPPPPAGDIVCGQPLSLFL